MPTGNRPVAFAPWQKIKLPVDLPDMKNFKPHGRPEPPLDEAPHEWLYPTIDGIRYKRETNSMPQWAGSCWYYLRFLDNKNDKVFIDPALEKAWMPVDLYVGGAEHCRVCTCCTVGSGTRCCTIAAMSLPSNRSRSS